MIIEAVYIAEEGTRRFCSFGQMALAVTFFLELAYRFAISKHSCWQFFCSGDDGKWNVFDLCRNVVSIWDMIIDSWEGRFVHGIATIRIVRIFRLVRIFASSKFLSDHYRAVQTAFWQMVNFSLVIVMTLVVCSIWATIMLWDFPDDEISECYRDLGSSMWTLFKIMTMDGWIAHVEPIMDLHPSLKYFYAVFVFLSISSVSIVPAIFIENLIEDREKARRVRARAKRRLRQSKASAEERLRLEKLLREQEDTESSCWSDYSPSCSPKMGRQLSPARHASADVLEAMPPPSASSHVAGEAVQLSASGTAETEDATSRSFERFDNSLSSLTAGKYNQERETTAALLLELSTFRQEIKQLLQEFNAGMLAQVSALCKDSVEMTSLHIPAMHAAPFRSHDWNWKLHADGSTSSQTEQRSWPRSSMDHVIDATPARTNTVEIVSAAQNGHGTEAAFVNSAAIGSHGCAQVIPTDDHL